MRMGWWMERDIVSGEWLNNLNRLKRISLSSSTELTA